jgi:predicted nuclease of restriction endonuclease-like (RecB) superfamily
MSEKRKQRGIEKEQVVFPIGDKNLHLPAYYKADLKLIIDRVRSSRLKIVLTANSEMVLLYHDIGAIILQRQKTSGWGAKIIDRLAADLKEQFPEMKGVSPRNLKYMRAFAQTWPKKAIVQEVLAQISWYHNIALLEKLDNNTSRLWYAKASREHGWSHNILGLQIQAHAHERHGKSTNNFGVALPNPESDMAQQIFKDPYLFDFLGTADIRREKELEDGLVLHVQKFLLELGAGFAFVGRQVHLELGGSDFYLDLLFYHLKLRCYVVIELKAGELDPGDVSQLNMYMNVVDDVLKHADDKKTIGLLLVKKKSKIIAEYCLRGYKNPIGIAAWEKAIQKGLPKNLKGSLPSIEEIEAEMSRGENV